MSLLTTVPYLMGIGACICVLIACYWKPITRKFINKEGHLQTQLVWGFGSILLIFGSQLLSYDIGYRDSFPVLKNGETATVLAVYHPDFKHDEQKFLSEKKCLVRLKDGRETLVDEKNFYPNEMDDMVIGDVIIQETEGYIYVLRHINIHRTIPPTIRNNQYTESPFKQDTDS